jgi:glyoxylase-like metal-dependent hydrolase (beta-lactamase superfamily II)
VVGHVTEPTAALLDRLPGWATLVRAPNPGPMTLDGTNTWVLRGPEAPACVVVDPGPLDEGHLSAVAAQGPIQAILLTHHHADHSEGVPRLAELTGAPVLTDPAPAATAVGLEIQPLQTPGHTADSVCFHVWVPPVSGYQSRSGPDRDGAQAAVLTGDTILGRGTTVVAAPDGDLGDYLVSLGRLIELGPIPVLPGHGPALADCAAAATYYLRHRQARLDQVRAAVAAGATTAEDVVARVYADVDRSLWPAATWSVQAQLAYLRRESRPPPTGLDEP